MLHFSDLSNFEGLFRTIIKALRPVVYQEVQKALSASYNSYNVDANELSELIMTELTPFVREALTQEVQNAQANTLSEDQVVQLIITELRPTVIRIIKATVQSENIDLSNLDQLLQTILIQLVSKTFSKSSLTELPHKRQKLSEMLKSPILTTFGWFDQPMGRVDQPK